MALRKAAAYSGRVARPFTRISRSKGKDYIKVSPHNKIAKFHIGNQKDYLDGKHPFVVKLVAEEKVQIRDNALESGRMFVTKIMDERDLGLYYFGVKVFPHHLLRENKTAAGAGADRLSSGMKHSYGIVIGRAALVRPNQEVFFVSCANEKVAKDARDVLSMIKSKIPGKTKVLFEKSKN